jgi:FOG: Ankyrin repeat
LISAKQEYSLAGQCCSANPFAITHTAIHLPQGSTPDPLTTSQYDLLGRVTMVTLPGGNTLQTIYSGSVVTTTDQVNRKTKREDVDTRSDHGFTPFLSAAFDGHYECARTLLERGADINAQDEEGYTGLMFLAKHKEDSKSGIKKKVFSSLTGIDPMKTARLLLDQGADVNIKNKHGKTALMLAEEKGNIQMVELLKQAGAAE